MPEAKYGVSPRAVTVRLLRNSLDVAMLTRHTQAKTPFSNTGLNSQDNWSVGLDWLDITMRGVSSGIELQELIHDIELLTDSVIDFSPIRRVFNGKYWAGSGRGDTGVMLWYNPPREASQKTAVGPDGNLFSHPGVLPPGCYCMTDADAVDVASRLPAYVRLVHVDDHPPYVEPSTGYAYPHHGYQIVPSDIPAEPEIGELKVAMSATVLKRVSSVALSEYLTVIRSAYVVHCSRVDIALDDNRKSVPIIEVVRASVNGDFFDCKYTQRIESGNRGEQVGVTVYFGSPASDAKLRVYDKFVESRGILDCNRWEVEFHRGKANEFLQKWLEWMSEGISEATQKMADVVLSAIDFRDRSSGDPNRARCSLLTWYRDMCAAVRASVVKIRTPVRQKTVQKSIDWVNRSVAASLAGIRTVLGSDFAAYLSQVLNEGAAKMSNQRRRIVNLTNRDDLCY